MKARFLIPCLLGLLLAVSGCSDDGASEAALPEFSGGVDQCLSAMDGLVLATPRDGGVSDAGPVDAGFHDPVDIGADCSYSCVRDLLELDPDIGLDCMNSCFDASPVGGLSDGCQECYVEAMYCVGTNCPIECLGSDRDACNACLGVYCEERLDACTGL